MALAWPTEAGLQQIVRGERAEPRRQCARAADQDPDDRRPQIVVHDARRHAVEVRERAHVPVEKADLILALVDPREVATGVHQPHQKEPRLPTDAVEIDQYLEEVDLGEIARSIGQRHEHLTALALPLGDGLFDERDADPMALGDQQLVEPRGRQLLLPTGPSARFGQQPVHPVPHGVPDRPRPDQGLLPNGGGLLEILSNRQPRNPELFRDLPPRAALHQHFVTNDMHLIHLEHPSQRTPEPTSSASPPSGPQVDHFPSGEWITF